MRLRSFYILLFLGAAIGLLRAQNTFIKRFDLESSVIGGSRPIQTSDGGYVVGCSFGNDPFIQLPCLVKVDPKGNLLWTKIIGSGVAGHVISLAASRSGSFFALGPNMTDSGARLFVMKCDSLGNTLWTRTLNAPVDSNSCGIAEADDGGCVVAGDLISPDLLGDEVFVLKLASDGKTEWIRHILPDQGSTINSLINSVIRLDSANYILSGYVTDVSQPFFSTSGLSIIKLSSSGSIGWNRVIHGFLFGSSAVALADGGFAICGEAFSNNSFTSNLYAAAFDSSGVIRWGKQVDAFGNEFGQAIAEAGNGDLIIGGAFGSTDSLGAQPTDSALFVRMNKHGDLRTVKVISVPNMNSICGGLIRSSDGGFVYSGFIGNDLSNGPFGLLLGKLTATGDGCALKNQLGSVLATDSVFDLPFTLANDLTAGPFDLTAGSSLKLNQYELCSATMSVQPPHVSEENISLFPNPLFEDSPLNIFVDGSLAAGIYDLSLYDLLGNAIKKARIQLSGEKQNILFDVSKCAAGVYWVELRNEGEPETIRRINLVKE